MRNISLGSYLKREDYIQYTFILDSLKAKDCLNFDLNKLTYNDVIKCFRILSTASDIKDVCELFGIVYGLTEKQFFKLPIIKYFQTKKFIEEKFVNLREHESKLLKTSDADSAYFEAAGGKRLNNFSDVLPLDKLAKIYGGYPMDYGDKKYVEVIYLLKMNQEINMVDKKFNEIKYGHS